MKIFKIFKITKNKIIIILVVMNLFQLWWAKNKIILERFTGVVEVIKMDHFEEFDKNYYSSKSSFVQEVRDRIAYDTKREPDRVQKIDTSEVSPQEIPTTNFIDAEFEKGVGHIRIRENDKVKTYIVETNEYGKTIVKSLDSTAVEVKTQRLGFMKALGIGLNNKNRWELNFDFIYLNKLWVVKNLRFGINYERVPGELGNLGAVGSWLPFPRWNNVHVCSGWYFPSNDFRVSVKVKLFEF